MDTWWRPGFVSCFPSLEIIRLAGVSLISNPRRDKTLPDVLRSALRLRQEAGVVTVPDLHLDSKCDVAQGYINTMHAWMTMFGWAAFAIPPPLEAEK
jgi:hypothetical protein